jgi:hypothetical protein
VSARERARELGEDRQVGMEPNKLDPDTTRDSAHSFLSLRGAQGADHPLRGFFGVLMLPDTYDPPARFDELPVRVVIATRIRFDLLSPPVGVCLGLAAVLWAAVPEAAVHEYGESSAREDDVCAAAFVGQWSAIDPEAETALVESGSQGALGSSVSLADGLHAPPRLVV